MLIETFFLWCILILYLVPVLFFGFLLVRKVSVVDRIELLLPSGFIVGISYFIFLLNSLSFFMKGYYSVVISYLILILTALAIFISKGKNGRLKWPSFKEALFIFSSLLIWGGLIIWKSANALIGSDTNLYYSIAHSFIKGNFPFQTPWQPDLALSYHVGISQLLGAFYFFTNLEFQFLHLFFSSIFILCLSQIIIWIFKRHNSLISFILANLAAALILISFGFIKFVIPTIPFVLPYWSDPRGLFLWIRDLPNVSHAIEVYGAPVNLDSLIYFIFHAFGLVLCLTLVVLIIYPKSKNLSYFLTLIITLAALALSNESLFAIITPPIIIIEALSLIRNGAIDKLKLGVVALFLGVIIVLLQGGMISQLLLQMSKIESSVVLFPKKEDIKEDFISYHLSQQASKLLGYREQWGPFIWIHVGSEALIVLLIILISFGKFSFHQKQAIIFFLLSGIFAILAYNFVVPKFLIANGNRLLVFFFIFSGLGIIYSLSAIYDNYKQRFIRVLIVAVTIWILIPTVLPPLMQLTKNRFGYNKLIPERQHITKGFQWMKDNLAFSARVVVLDANSPHPSGMVKAIMESGVFAPIFPGNIRAYTIEASPEYLDIAYTLDPKTLSRLGIDIIYMDSSFFETLSNIKKIQFFDNSLFTELFYGQMDNNKWERVVKINPRYFQTSKEHVLIGDLEGLVPLGSKVYIDNEENFSPSYIKRAIIFSLRNRDLYFLHQSGVYLNVEAEINEKNPDSQVQYNFLVLGKNTPLDNICKCEAVLIWRGLNDQVRLWKVNYR